MLKHDICSFRSKICFLNRQIFLFSVNSGPRYFTNALVIVVCAEKPRVVLHWYDAHNLSGICNARIEPKFFV